MLLVLFGMVFGAAPFENAVLTALSPFTGITISAINRITGFFEALEGIKNGYAENERLKEENQKLSGMTGAYEDLKKENEFLRKQLQVSSPKTLTLLEARVVSFDSLLASSFALIDKGTKDGVAEGMPVVRPGNALVGKVIKVYAGFSRVMLISDKDNKVSVKSAARGTSGVLSGAAGNLLLVEFIEKNSPVDAGELLVTSGLDGVYPKNLMVGWVKEVASRQEDIFKKAYVQPVYAGFSETQVFVISDYLR